MRLQPASKKELRRIAAGEIAGTLFMLSAFSAFGRLNHSVLLGALLGTGVAILNFYSLCISVQKAAAREEPDGAKLVMQTSYTRRMLITILTIVIGLTVDAVHWLAVLIPLLLPRVTILGLQMSGAYQPESETGKEG